MLSLQTILRTSLLTKSDGYVFFYNVWLGLYTPTDYGQRLESGLPERASGDFMSNILTDRSGSKRNLAFMELVAESIVLLNAGSDTTATA